MMAQASDLWTYPVDQRILHELDQHQRPYQQPLQRYVSAPERPLFTTHYQHSYSQQDYQQAVQVTASIKAFPHAKNNNRIFSPAPSQGLSSAISSSAHSPGAEFDDRLPDLSPYSPQSQNDFLPSANLFSAGEPFPDFYSGQQQTWSAGSHVNMSQVQTCPDPHFPSSQDLEFEADEGFMDQTSAFKTEYAFEQTAPTQQGGINMESSHSQHSLEWPSDEGIGSSIKDAPSPVESVATNHSSDIDAEGEPEEEESIEVIPPARSQSPYSPAPVEEDSDEDETYTPRSTRTRKRQATGSVYSPAVKRSRVTKAFNKSRAAKPILPQTRQPGDLACASCSRADFKDAATLSRHVKMNHLRPYICVFSFAGCESTFASKNEWKRHVGTQHLCLHSWICTQGACAKVLRPLPTSSSVSNRNRGAEFNRKDLFTQHLKRMHAPPGLKLSNSKGGKAARDWDEQIKHLQEDCKVVKRLPPNELHCCVEGCEATFEGPNCWDERMEHVGKHLDLSANRELDGGEKIIVDQGQDSLLVDWAVEQGIVVRKSGGGGYRFPREGELRGQKWKLHAHDDDD